MEGFRNLHILETGIISLLTRPSMAVFCFKNLTSDLEKWVKVIHIRTYLRYSLNIHLWYEYEKLHDLLLILG